MAVCPGANQLCRACARRRGCWVCGAWECAACSADVETVQRFEDGHENDPEAEKDRWSLDVLVCEYHALDPQPCGTCKQQTCIDCRPLHCRLCNTDVCSNCPFHLSSCRYCQGAIESNFRFTKRRKEGFCDKCWHTGSEEDVTCGCGEPSFDPNASLYEDGC